MTKLSNALFSATLTLALAAAFADAQATPKSPTAKPPAAKPAAPAPAPPPHAADQHAMCDCAACDPDHKDAHDGEHGGMHHGKMKCEMGEHECQMREAANLADIKVESTKLGATIQLTAKNAADAAKVQQFARNLAAHLAKHPEHEPHEH